jgi:putative sterol carrier protein
MRLLATTLSLALLLAGWAQGLQAGAAVNKITPTKQVFLAGYSPNRPNTGGVHDDIWARALVIQVGNERVAIVVCDLLGLLRDDVQKIRQRVKSVPPNRVMVLCTHVHSAPDTIGLWGPTHRPNRDATNEYMNFVIETVAKTVDEAASKLQPALVGFAKTTIEGVAKNYRIEQILDTEAAVMQFRSKADGKVIATLTNFACHPEVLNNDQLTSDFCHWYYQTVERAVGGVAIFANGALGGMISPAPGDPNPPKGRDWARAERFGTIIANRALEAIAKATFTDAVTLEHKEATYTVPLENENFKLALSAGIIPSGASLAGGKVTTESHLIRLGDAVMFTMPGEVQPNTGILLKRLLAPYGDPVFLFGLANDELGYILSLEDYYLKLYDYERSMSVGSEIGPAMVQAARQMMGQMTARTPTPVAAAQGEKSPVEQELEKYLQRFRPDRAGNFKATYRLVLEGAGEFYLRIAEGKATLSREGSASEAAVTIKAPAQVFVAIITGKRDPLDAYNTGELQVEGDIGIAQYLLFVFE